MQIAVILDPARLRRWHAWLVDQLAARGLDRISVQFVSSAPLDPPVGTELLLRLERISGRTGGENALDPLSPDDPVFARLSRSGTAADLTIDPRGCDPEPSPTALRPLYDGSPHERALWQSLLARRAPVISLMGTSLMGTGNAAPVQAALPALENPLNLSQSASTTLARVAEALAAAAADHAAGRPTVARLSRPPEKARHGSVAAMAAAVLAGKSANLLARRRGRTPRWAVAFRSTAHGRTHPPHALDHHAFTLLPDDGHRYYADPFLFSHDGQMHLFVEEVPDATGRGIISHCVLGPDGRFPTPRPVLERPYHLSYPQVFAHDGHIWMMPEASAAGAIELYRADPFPDRFVLHARLIEGSYHDATFFPHDGRLWIAAGSRCTGGSSWDGLSLFHADRLDGPWQAHALNPVRIDARASRPAGELYSADGHLWRPAQDCSGGYGSALTLCRIDRLTPDRFDETAVATLEVGGHGGAMGPHTINAVGGIEIIDVFAPRTWDPGG